MAEDVKAATQATKEEADVADFELQIEKDALAQAEHTTGIAGVYAGRSLAGAADDISDLLINATNGQRVDVLVVADSSIIADSELATALKVELTALRNRLLAAGIDVDAADAQDAEAQRTRSILPAGLPLMALLGALPSAIGALSKMIARQYTTSGVALSDLALGVDLRVAGSIRSKLGTSTAAKVFVQRFWQVDRSDLLNEWMTLARALPALSAGAAGAAAEAESSQAVLADATAQKVAAQLALQNLCDQPNAEANWKTAWDHMTEAATKDLTSLVQQSADASAKAIALRSLHDDLESFIASSLVPPAEGSCPLLRAMRAEWLSSDASRVVLYVRCIAGGVDQVLETKLGPDRRAIMAGTSVEYAAIRSGGELLFSGAFDNLWGGTTRLDQVNGFRGQMIDYKFVPNAERNEPALSN